MRPGWVARVLDKVFGIPGGGSVAHGLGRLLKTAHQRRLQAGAPSVQAQPDLLPSAEMSVLSEVDHSLAAADQKAARQLRKLVRAVVRTAHNSVARWVELEKLRDHPQWTVHRAPVRTRSFATWPTGASTETFDRNRGLASARSLLCVEVVFTVVESFFWYSAFSTTIDQDAGWAHPHRISAILLALLIPVAGVAGARLAGGLAHRWFTNYEGVSRRRHWGAVAALLVFATVLVAVVLLVLARFDEANTALGATTVPAWPMALVFGGVLMVDMASRVFMISEIREQYHRRSADFTKLKNKVIKANARHAEAWTALRTAVQSNRDQAARIETVGARLLTDSRALWGNPNSTYPVPPAVPGHRDPDDRPHTRRRRSAMLMPNPQPLHLLNSKHALAPSRSLDDAVDVLSNYLPWDPEVLAAEIRRLWDDLHGERTREDAHVVGWPGGPDLKAS